MRGVREGARAQGRGGAEGRASWQFEGLARTPAIPPVNWPPALRTLRFWLMTKPACTVGPSSLHIAARTAAMLASAGTDTRISARAQNGPVVGKEGVRRGKVRKQGQMEREQKVAARLQRTLLRGLHADKRHVRAGCVSYTNSAHELPLAVELPLRWLQPWRATTSIKHCWQALARTFLCGQRAVWQRWRCKPHTQQQPTPSLALPAYLLPLPAALQTPCCSAVSQAPPPALLQRGLAPPAQRQRGLASRFCTGCLLRPGMRPGQRCRGLRGASPSPSPPPFFLCPLACSL